MFIPISRSFAFQKPAHESVKEAAFTLPCDSVVLAIGQTAEPGSVAGLTLDHGMVAVEDSTGQTSISHVFAGGDAVGVANIITAVADGRRAAVSIDRMLRGNQATLHYTPDTVCVDPEKVLRRAGYFKDEEAPFTHEDALTEEEAVAEAGRCLNCGCGEGCQLCKTICCDFAPEIIAPDTLQIGREACVACGMCFNRCPNGNIEMVSTFEKV